MATRLLPARIVGPRVLAPRISGRGSASGTQTATHLALTTQPGGAVSGVALTIQPGGQALDGSNALDPTFGGTISAVVSSGAATVTGGGSVVAAGGGFQFTGLTLTGTPGLVTITLSSGSLTPVTSVTFLLSAASSVVLVTSPTRVTMPQRVARVGDAIDFTETLKGFDGSAQDLTGAQSVLFSLDAVDGTVLASGTATVLQSGSGTNIVNKGQVTYRVKASVAVPIGVSKWRYKAVWDADTKLSFPDDSNGELTVIADLP